MTHYQVLGLPADASPAVIRQAYRRLALLTHPDRTPDPAAHARFLVISAAYEVLIDPSRRFAYDQHLSTPVLPKPPAAPTTGRARDEARRAATRVARPVRPQPVRSAEEVLLGPHYRLYLRYTRLARRFNWLVVVFGLLLGLDFFYAVSYPFERIESRRYSSQYNRQVYYAYSTPHARFHSMYKYPEGTVLALRRTPLFGQVLSFREARDPVEYDYHNDLTVYSTIGLLPLLMLAAALAGAWPGPLSRRSVECAVSAALMLPVVLWLLTIT